VPCVTRVTPLVDTLMFCPGGLDFGDDEDSAVDELDAESDDEESESDGGLAAATHGIATSPAPMPRATANPPIRPTYLAYAIVSPFLAATTVDAG